VTTISALGARQVTSCPACGYPTLDASLCALCSPLAAMSAMGTALTARLP
jgi:hypothetical protein